MTLAVCSESEYGVDHQIANPETGALALQRYPITIHSVADKSEQHTVFGIGTDGSIVYKTFIRLSC
jgi:hypothetical protein